MAKPEFDKIAQELNKEMISRRKETPSVNVSVIASALRKLYVMGMIRSCEIINQYVKADLDGLLNEIRAEASRIEPEKV